MLIINETLKVVLLFPLSFFIFFYIFSLFPQIAKARPACNQREDGRGAERQFETAGTKLNFNFAAPISD